MTGGGRRACDALPNPAGRPGATQGVEILSARRRHRRWTEGGEARPPERRRSPSQVTGFAGRCSTSRGTGRSGSSVKRGKKIGKVATGGLARKGDRPHRSGRAPAAKPGAALGAIPEAGAERWCRSTATGPSPARELPPDGNTQDRATGQPRVARARAPPEDGHPGAGLDSGPLAPERCVRVGFSVFRTTRTAAASEQRNAVAWLVLPAPTIAPKRGGVNVPECDREP